MRSWYDDTPTYPWDGNVLNWTRQCKPRWELLHLDDAILTDKTWIQLHASCIFMNEHAGSYVDYSNSPCSYGSFTLTIYYEIAITIRFKNGFCTHFCDCNCDSYLPHRKRNCNRNHIRNNSRVINLRCEWTLEFAYVFLLICISWMKEGNGY